MNYTFLPQRLIAKISALFIGFLFAVCLTFCWYQWKMVRTYSRFPSRRLDFEWLMRVMTGRFSKGVPFTQILFQEVKKTINSFREKGLCVLWIVRPVVLVFNGNLVKNLVNSADLSDKGPIFDINKPLFGNGILSSKHEVWKVQRKLLNPAFHMKMIKSSLPSTNKYASQLVQKIDAIVDKPTEEVWNILKYSSMQNMFDYVLGVKPENENLQNITEEFMELVHTAEIMFMTRLSRPWLYYDSLLPFFKFGKKYSKVMSSIDDVLGEVMNELKKEHSKDDTQALKSCGSILTKLHLEDFFSKKDVRDNLTTLMGAGFDTVSTSMLMSLYTLGHHPEAQEKAYDEVVSIVPEGDIAYQDLAQMKYLECVIKETMRLYSTIPTISRRANRDIQCGQYTIPKGADVWISFFMMHRDPNVFPEPEKFDPDRFYDTSELRPWMYMPFAEGYRNCIGKRFALLEIKVQLAHILRRFKITSLSKIDDSELDSAIVLRPTVIPRLLFENRHSTS